MPNESQEFYMSVAILGGIVFAGSLVVILLGLLGMAIYNKATKKKTINELYDKKQRENGQHKGGSQGVW
jgi:hypothetical protein